MIYLTRALWAEALKQKRSLGLWLTVIIPLGIVSLQFAVVLKRGESFASGATDAWGLFGEQMFLFWALLAFPLFVALETALLGAQEHSSCQWKHLCALPLPRWVLYTTKQLAGMALVAVSMVGLVGFTSLAGLALQVLRPGIGFGTGVPWSSLWSYAGAVYLASWLIISIQTWAALRWRSFVVPMAVAVAATILGMAIGDLGVAALFPWSLPVLVSKALVFGEIRWPALLLGSLGGIAFALWGCRDVTRREVF